MVSDPLWENSVAVLGTSGLLFARGVTIEAVAYASLGKAVRDGTAKLASDPGLVTHEALVSSV
jgi:hypothetical protein